MLQARCEQSMPTSRIKTVRAGERDCPQDKPLSK